VGSASTISDSGGPREEAVSGASQGIAVGAAGSRCAEYGDVQQHTHIVVFYWGCRNVGWAGASLQGGWGYRDFSRLGQ
jgi:hypothetical protein